MRCQKKNHNRLLQHINSEILLRIFPCLIRFENQVMNESGIFFIVRMFGMGVLVKDFDQVIFRSSTLKFYEFFVIVYTAGSLHSNTNLYSQAFHKTR